MKEQIVTLETAKLAKEVGFTEYTDKVYVETKAHTIQYPRETWETDVPYKPPRVMERKYVSTDMPSYHVIVCNAPTQSLLQKFIREEYNIRIYVRQGISGNFIFEIYIWDNPNTIGKWTRIGNIPSYNTFEDALEKGLQEALKTIKNEH